MSGLPEKVDKKYELIRTYFSKVLKDSSIGLDGSKSQLVYWQKF